MSVPVQVHPTLAADVAPRRARMGRYALWQARDYVFERGLPTMLVGSIFPFLAALALRARRPAGALTVEQHAAFVEMSLMSLRPLFGSIVFLGALLGMNGLVSNDRKNGHYRFLFAKPVTPERYYGQAFIVHAAGFLVAIVLLGLLWGAFVVPVMSVDMLVAMWLLYIGYAGIAFFLTAAAKWDWLSLVAVALVSTVLWERYGASTHPLATLLYLLPPLPRTDSVYAAVATQSPLPWNTLAWFAGYGVACFLAALVVLRHRRLATP